MPLTEEAGTVEDLEFKWGKMRGVGGKKKEFQFFESFSYDGVDYALYDCVYMYKEGEPEPYIGKIIKIWQNPDKSKKVKIQWFFHPLEISNWLGDEEAAKKEMFLASGEGAGAANVNPLEAIAGKCNVVCTSKDSRNPQPSEQELQMADFIFYRTFDVKQCTISDKMDDKVSGLEVKFIFNKEIGKTFGITKLASVKSEDAVACRQALQLPGKEPPEEGSAYAKDSGVESKSVCGSKPANGANDAATSGQERTVSGDKATRNMNSVQKDDAKALVTTTPSERKTKTGPGKDLSGADSCIKSAKDADIGDRPSKKARVDSAAQLSENKNNKSGQKLSIRSDGSPDMVAILTSGGKPKAEVTSLGPDKDSKMKADEKIRKLPNGKLLKVSAGDPLAEDRKTGVFEVTRRPDDERSKWFKELPWGERMKNAHEQGAVVLLSNLDPKYTSGDVEDIIWHAYKENCSAKMVQRTTFSSPHSGQAYVILKTKGAAEKIVKELTEGCLMLTNGRPLVGSIPAPSCSGKQSAFVGHLFIDKIKQPMHRGKEAVSTSHFSQPNTIEYDMSLEWRLLQSRFDSCWKSLYKQQRDDLRKFKAKLQLK